VSLFRVWWGAFGFMHDDACHIEPDNVVFLWGLSSTK
jgi:hypothetical protein